MTFIDPAAFDLPDVSKAVDTTETALLRQSLESVITKVDMKGTPLRKRWSRTQANGLTHEYTQRTSLGSPISPFYADGRLPSDGTTRYVRKGKQIKALGETGKVTGLMLAGGRNFADQLALEQTARMTSVLQGEENALIYGDSTKGYNVLNDDGSTSVQYLEFDGIKRITKQEGGIVVDASTFPDGAKLSIPLLNYALQLVYDANGESTCIHIGSREKRFFNELLQSFVRYNGDGVVHVERQLGTSVMFYDSDFGSLPMDQIRAALAAREAARAGQPAHLPGAAPRPVRERADGGDAAGPELRRVGHEHHRVIAEVVAQQRLLRDHARE